MINVGEALGRRLGPLPAWAWGGIVGVGLLVWRSTDRSSSSSATVGGATVGVGGQGASLASPPVQLDGSSGSDAGTAAAGTAIVGGDGFPGVIGRFSSAFTLQQQLNDALARLSALAQQKASINDSINANLDAYRSRRISKATYTNRNAIYTKQLSTVGAQLTATTSSIADIRARLAALFAAPAAA